MPAESEWSRSVREEGKGGKGWCTSGLWHSVCAGSLTARATRRLGLSRPHPAAWPLAVRRCGLIAWSLFNDSYTLLDPFGNEVKLDQTSISWQSDIDQKFGNNRYGQTVRARRRPPLASARPCAYPVRLPRAPSPCA